MDRITEEKRVVEKMIRLYCRRKEGNRVLCQDCSEMMAFAFRRLDRCRFGCGKPTCKKCPIHCHSPQMKVRMQEVMRWSGPRMILYHPIDAIRHLIRELR